MKRKIEKYVIHCDDLGVWWARVPWGTFEPFDSWKDAAGYLAMRHHLKSEHKPYRRSRNGSGRAH